MNDRKRYTNLIDHTGDNWTSETKDNFRKFQFQKRKVSKNKKSKKSKKVPKTEYQEKYQSKNLEDHINLHNALWNDFLKNQAKSKSLISQENFFNKSKSIEKFMRDGLNNWKNSIKHLNKEIEIKETQDTYGRENNIPYSKGRRRKKQARGTQNK